MSENIISQEIAEETIQQFFEYFEVDLTDDPQGDGDLKASFMVLVKAVTKGRLEIKFDTDGEPEVTQNFKKAVDGKSSHIWDWTRIGLAKRNIVMKDKGLQPFKMFQEMAATMFKVDKAKVVSLHPLDNSLLEVIASFFKGL